MNIRRGDIFYISKNDYNSTGSEQEAGRPAIVVSNDMANASSSVIEVVYLTTAPKHDLPTHVTIRSSNKVSIALCEQPTPVSTERVGSYVASCTDDEMSRIDKALAISLALDVEKCVETVESEPATVTLKYKNNEITLASNDVLKVLFERDMYQELYNGLLAKLIK